MSNRDDGFPIADVSTTLLDDPKVRKLSKRYPDDGALAASICVFMATLLGSWREGRRLTASEAESWIEPTDERLADLRDVGLFDAKNRVNAKAWEAWFRPAWERREQARANGRKGAARRWGIDSDPIPDGSQPDGRSMPDKPTDRPPVSPSVSPSINPASSPSGDKKNGLKTSVTDEEHLPPFLRVVQSR